VLPFALVAGWSTLVGTHTDRYVRAVAPLAHDPAVQNAVETRVATTVTGAITAQVPAGPLGDAAARAARGLVRGAVSQVVEGPAFPPAWRAGNRSVHREVIGVLSGSRSAHVDAQGRVELPLDPVVSPVLTAVGTKSGVPASAVPQVHTSIPLMKASDLQTARAAYAGVTKAGIWLPLLWAVLVLIAVVTSPRVGRTLSRLGVGSAVGLGLLAGVLALGRGWAVSRVPHSTGTLLGALWDAALHSLWHAIEIGLVISAAAVVVGWVLGLGGRGRAATSG
jgi:hypothetical protein